MTQETTGAVGVRYARIPVSAIRPRSNVRTEFDAESIGRLAVSLKTHGQQSPIIVAPDAAEAGRYLIVAGERRWRAARLAGLETVEARVLPAFPEDHAELATWQLIENCQRENLRPMEEAHAFTRLLEHKAWTSKRLAEELGLAPSTVTRSLALLRLPEDLAAQVDGGALKPAIARELARLSSEAAMRAILAEAMERALPAEEVRELVTSQIHLKPRGRGPSGPSRSDPVIRLGRWEAVVASKRVVLRFLGGKGGAPRSEQTLEAVERLAAALRERLGADVSRADGAAAGPSRPGRDQP
ncbi:MAG: ParB/RepB/Spo0J family partition protein [Isosphaeraceae bacterium]